MLPFRRWRSAALSEGSSLGVWFTFFDFLGLGFILEGAIVFLHQGEKGWHLWVPGFALGLVCLAFRNRSPQFVNWFAFIATKQVLEGSYAIESRAFRGCYLRMDGSGVTHFQDNGAGVVNCQKGHEQYERFRIVRLKDGLYAIESIEFRNCWLRMDGRPISLPSDKGIVNCQWGGFPKPFEKFAIVRLPKGSVALQSACFDDVYLGMDATELIGRQPYGGGTVYCRRSHGLMEEFRLKRLPKE